MPQIRSVPTTDASVFGSRVLVKRQVPPVAQVLHSLRITVARRAPPNPAVEGQRRMERKGV